MQSCNSGWRTAAFWPCTHYEYRNRKNMKINKIAVIPGDGIGKEVMPKDCVSLRRSRISSVSLPMGRFDWSCDYYLKHGKMMPDNWKERLEEKTLSSLAQSAGRHRSRSHLAVGSLVKFRQEFDQYVNLRRQAHARHHLSLANRKIGDIDFYIVRKIPRANTQQLADACSPAPSVNSLCSKVYSHARALIAS